MIRDRTDFIEKQKDLDTTKLVFLDETYGRCDQPEYYGWSKVGFPPVMKGVRHGKKMSVVGAIAADGGRGQMAFEGTFNTDRFVQYVEEVLGPRLNPGDVVVMDGLSVHKTARVREALARHGADCLILPAYSPELNPIEHLWSALKVPIRRDCPRNIADLARSIQDAWEQVVSFASSWIKHCGYTLST